MSKCIGIFLAGLLIISWPRITFSQTTVPQTPPSQGENNQPVSCDEQLRIAEDEFSSGHFYAVPSKLQNCLEGSDLSQDQKVRAYLLLCQVYLIIDDKIAAEDNYLKLLKVDPEFIPNDKEHTIDIVYLSKKFTATPIFTPHFRFGLNSSFYRSIYSVSTEPYSVPSNNSIQLGIQLGGGVDWNINDFLSLCGEIDFSTRGFKRVRDGISGTDIQTVTAGQNWIDVPIYLKYSYFLNKDFRLFGYAGVAINYLLSSKNEFVYTDNKPGAAQLVSTGPSTSVIYQENQFNKSWIIGGGVKYKWGKDFLYADLRYMGGLSNLAVEDQLYYADPKSIDKSQIGNPDYYLSSNVTKYKYTSDIFRLDNISISFGFIHPIYNPRKVKKARTKGVLRQIKKEERGKSK